MTLAFAALALVFGPPQPNLTAGGLDRRPALVRVAAGVHADLQKALMGKFKAMNDKQEGIFHEDISGTVAPYFPPGQPIAETKKVIAEQHLGTLMPFKGKPMADEHAPMATRFRLMGARYSQVEVVLHFDFDGDSEANYKVKSVRAYLRGTSM